LVEWLNIDLTLAWLWVQPWLKDTTVLHLGGRDAIGD